MTRLAAGQSHRVPSRPNTLHKILLSPQGPAKKRAAGAAPPTWFLEIKEHLGGQREDSIVEVIRCDAYPATEDSATSKSKVNVVLKLYPRSQAEEDPHKPTRTRLGHHLPEYAKLMERYHGSSRITRTATVFRELRHLQGCELEYCYGIYNIVRDNKPFIGVVVEDLGNACSLEKAIAEIKLLGDHKAASRELSDMMLAANRTQKLFTEHDLSYRHKDLHDLFFFRSSDKDNSQCDNHFKPVVAVGFSRAQTKVEIEMNVNAKNEAERRKRAEFSASSGSSDSEYEPRPWYRASEYSLGANFLHAFDVYDPIWEGSSVAKAFEENNVIPPR